MHEGERHWWWKRPFLYIGRIAEDKGVANILEAWMDLRSRFGEDCPPLWLVGGTPAEIQAVRASVGWNTALSEGEREGKVLWWGYLDAAGISALLCRVAVVVMHSRYEPGGRVVLEAMAQGVPVIATPYGFAAELVQDWRTGFLVDFGDHQSLVARMAHFVRQPLLRNVLGADARRAALRSLARWDFVGVHEAVYEEVTSAEEKGIDIDNKNAEAPIYSQFRTRAIPPIYPIDDQTPPAAAIQSLVEATAGGMMETLEPLPQGLGSSRLWRAQAAGKSWIVKCPYARLNKGVLFATLPPKAFFSSGQKRFDLDRLSGTLPGFVPWDGADSENHLLIRRELPQLTEVGPDDIASAACAYRALSAASFDFGGIKEVLVRNWKSATRDDVLEGYNEIQLRLHGQAWDRGCHYGARLAWRMLELDVRHGPIPAGLTFPQEALNYFALFSDLAESETDLPITLTHGSGAPAHCLRTAEGAIRLIDGEHIHPALAGEDMAALIYFSVADQTSRSDGDAPCSALLEAAAGDAEEWKRLLSWLGYFAMDQLRESTILVQRESRDAAIRHLLTLMRLAEARASR